MPYNINVTYALLCELILALILLLAWSRAPGLGRLVYARSVRIAGYFARRPVLLILAAGIAPIALRIAVLPIVPPPDPQVMEEFNHLFLASTYELGRVTNPVHPFSVMLQTYQQISWPYHVSARPPLPPIFIFLGQTFFGSPFAGNLIALGLTSAALSWALLGWMSARWAAFGSYLIVVTACLFGYWINSYWAPTTIVLGGALLFGAVPRIERSPTFGISVVCIIALILLAGTRPYENGVFAAVCCGWLAYRFLQPERRDLLPRAMLRVVLPMVIGVCAIITMQLMYNQATTGNLALMPYQIWRASQDMTPVFLWQDIAPDRTFYNNGASFFAQWNVSVVRLITDQGLTGWLYLFSRHGVTFRDLLGPFLFLAFCCWSPNWRARIRSVDAIRNLAGLLGLLVILLTICGPVAGSFIKVVTIYVLLKRWANSEERLPVLVLIVGMIATSLPTFYMNVYFAAFAAPIFVLTATGFRNIVGWDRFWGSSLAGFILLGTSLVPVGHLIASAAHEANVPVRLWGPPLSRFDLHLPQPRESVRKKLQSLPGQHVVFVKLAPRTSAEHDPVWNDPQVDTQKIVWMRDLRSDWTAAALDYYKGRTFWSMTVERRGQYSLQPFKVSSRAVPASERDLPNPDRQAAEALGARRR